MWLHNFSSQYQEPQKKKRAQIVGKKNPAFLTVNVQNVHHWRPNTIFKRQAPEMQCGSFISTRHNTDAQKPRAAGHRGYLILHSGATICGPSLWNLRYVILLAPRILRSLLDLKKMHSCLKNIFETSKS
jgi:hypothetical protein